MELFFETRTSVENTLGKLQFRQAEPEILPTPVLVGDSPADGCGVALYGTVLHDGGMYRMWYQCYPRDWDGRDVTLVAYAESDNGLEWRKPRLGLVDYHGKENNLCDLSMASPNVFIDPAAPPSHRYRATGYRSPGLLAKPPIATRAGYYTAHSADGLHWELDSPEPTWEGGDVITSIYHPTQQRGIVALKSTPRVKGIPRRSVRNAELRGGEWSRAIDALLPDDFDDVAALARGYASGDYYGMGMLPAGQSTVGFLWHFHHSLPYAEHGSYGTFGVVDVGLVFQEMPGDRWLHAPGRPDFISHKAHPWMAGGVFTASSAVEVGDEHWLYFGASRRSHDWNLDANWQVNPERQRQMLEEGIFQIGLARWPKDRLFGFEADPVGELPLNITGLTQPSELALNYKAAPSGGIRVKLVTYDRQRNPSDVAGRTEADAVPLTGDCAAGVVAWKSGTVIEPQTATHLYAHILLDCATVYAYELRPVGR